MAYATVNPADGKTVKTFPELSDAQLEQKLATAQAAYETWRHTSYAQRAAIIGKAAALLHEQADAYARLITIDMG